MVSAGRSGPPMPVALNLASSPQPSGRACDVEEQPSARGRLRAVAPQRAQIQNSRFKIQNYRIGPRLAKDAYEQTRVAGLRRAKLRSAAVPFGTANIKLNLFDKPRAEASFARAMPRREKVRVNEPFRQAEGRTELVRTMPRREKVQEIAPPFFFASTHIIRRGNRRFAGSLFVCPAYRSDEIETFSSGGQDMRADLEKRLAAALPRVQGGAV